MKIIIISLSHLKITKSLFVHTYFHTFSSLVTIKNNVIKGYGEINSRVQSYIQNCNDVFDGFKMLQLNAPEYFSKLYYIILYY